MITSSKTTSLKTWSKIIKPEWNYLWRLKRSLSQKSYLVISLNYSHVFDEVIFDTFNEVIKWRFWRCVIWWNDPPVTQRYFYFFFLTLYNTTNWKKAPESIKKQKGGNREKYFFHREKVDNVSFLAIFVVSTIIKSCFYFHFHFNATDVPVNVCCYHSYSALKKLTLKIDHLHWFKVASPSTIINFNWTHVNFEKLREWGKAWSTFMGEGWKLRIKRFKGLILW